MPDKDYFSPEYGSDDRTGQTNRPKAELEIKEIKIDTEKYGINKPIRKIIKAKLIDDKD